MLHLKRPCRKVYEKQHYLFELVFYELLDTHPRHLLHINPTQISRVPSTQNGSAYSNWAHAEFQVF